MPAEFHCVRRRRKTSRIANLIHSGRCPGNLLGRLHAILRGDDDPPVVGLVAHAHAGINYIHSTDGMTRRPVPVDEHRRTEIAIGVNPAAVEWMTKVEGGYGKVVWLPTFDSEAQVKLSGDNRPFAPVVRDGKILPEVLAVIDIAAKHDLVLEMGHSSPQESLLMIPEAKRRGVKHVVVTHAMASPGGSMTLAEMRDAAKQGVLLELVYSPATDEQLTKEAEAIKAIGAASFVLSSDLGQPPNPLHTDGLLALYKGLMAHGVSAADIDLMARKNPARLLGLEP